MSFEIGHVHLKCADPKIPQIITSSISAASSWPKSGRGFRVDLHGAAQHHRQIDSQNHPQYLGIEHLAVQTDDYVGRWRHPQERCQGARRAEHNGRHVAFSKRRRRADGSDREGLTYRTSPGRPKAYLGP